MQRLLVTYRWELWLLGGIPFIFTTVAIMLPILLGWAQDRFRFSWEDGYWLSGFGPALLRALLLGVSYLRVRRLDRDLLPLVWGYFLASAVISALGFVALVLQGDRFGLVPYVWVSVLPNSWMNLLLKLLALLWFARRASRFSLLHAFFLAGFMSTPSWIWALEGILSSDANRLLRSAELHPVVLIGVIIPFVIAVVLLRVWLLGNFDSRGRVFRRNAVMALVTTQIVTSFMSGLYIVLLVVGLVPYAYLLLLFLTVAWWPVVFGLVYLVRARRPAMEAEPMDASVE